MEGDPDFQEEAKGLYELLKGTADLMPQDSSIFRNSDYREFAINVLGTGLEGMYYRGCNNQSTEELRRFGEMLRAGGGE